MDRSRLRKGMVTPAVVRAFRSIGWGWGGEWSGDTKDYMHFSHNGALAAPAPPWAGQGVGRVARRPRALTCARDLGCVPPPRAPRTQPRVRRAASPPAALAAQVVAGARSRALARRRPRAPARALARARRPLDRPLARRGQGGRAQPRDPRRRGGGAARDLRVLGLGRPARRPDPQLRRRAHGDPAGDRVLPAQLPSREDRGLSPSSSPSSSRPCVALTRPSSGSSIRRT